MQPDSFAKELLPTVFKHNNYTSFVRQLNIYGFRKLPASHQEFSHPCFKKDQPHLLTQICRGGLPSNSGSEGPQAEITILKSQVDRLTKALSYALAELHRRGYDALCFDWKELVFVDPSALSQGPPGSVVIPKPQVESGGGGAQKRPAATGSMMYLQTSVEETRAEKEASKRTKVDQHEDAAQQSGHAGGLAAMGAAPVVPAPHGHQSQYPLHAGPPGMAAMGASPAIPPPNGAHVSVPLPGTDPMLVPHGAHAPAGVGPHLAALPPAQAGAAQHGAGAAVMPGGVPQPQPLPAAIPAAHLQSLMNSLHDQGALAEDVSEACRLLDVAATHYPRLVLQLLSTSPGPTPHEVIQALQGIADPNGVVCSDSHMAHPAQQQSAPQQQMMLPPVPQAPVPQPLPHHQLGMPAHQGNVAVHKV